MCGITLVFGIAYLFYQSVLAAFFLFPVFLGYYYDWKKECVKKKELEFQQQFREALHIFLTALNVGYSIENAIREVPKEMRVLYGTHAMINREFLYMIRQMEMNITVEQALVEFSHRVKMEDVSNFVIVFTILKRSGGDMMKVLRSTIQKICMKLEVKQEIETLVAAKQMEFKVMSLIPIGIILYMKWSFPEFMEVLYGSVLGRIVMTVCLGMYISAWHLGKKLLEIEV